MRRSDHRTLLNQGRKAGLTTHDIYRALATRPPETADNSNRLADGNGFVSDFTDAGQRVYRPVDGKPAT